MSTITTTDGTQIFYKDWGTGQPIVFSHGWPLSADDWDTQPSPRPTSPATSSRSPCPRWSCTATMTRSCPTPTPGR